MSFLQLLFLAFVQAVSEFLPISSSGHLNLFQSIFGLTPSLVLDIFLNTATLFSVFYIFRHQFRDFLKKIPLIFIGTLPAAILGFLFKDKIDLLFTRPDYLPLFFLITSVLLLAQKFITPKKSELTPVKALIIGLFQALALLPGVSRSASTLFAGLLLGLPLLQAFQFSFYLFIPASLGALVLNFTDISLLSSFISLESLLAFLFAFIVGIISLRLLQKLFTHRHLWYFAFYTLALSVILFFF
ncbi:undecaprenyl-diphosphate phosphatase [Patescibacteria group bacterium]|nr:undecaprenyl-diphosphate phosphatase [Patescibacteria group bacterium]